MVRRALLLLLVAVGSPLLGQSRGVAGVARAVTELPSAGKRWALLIGITKYQDPTINKPPQAERDADAMADALIRYASFPSDQVIVLATDKDASRQPTRANILKFLSNLTGIVPDDGLLVVGFAGHGIERQNRSFLLPSDVQLTDDVRLLEETAISVKVLRDWIETTKAPQKIVFLDACRNDPAVGRGDGANTLSNAYTNTLRFDVHNAGVEAFATLYATSVGQRAYEYPKEKHGFFTWAVVQGLKGEAANADGSVTLGSLVRYVQTLVPKLVRIEFGESRKQVPYAQVEGYRADELVISGKVPVRRALLPEVQPPSPPAKDPPASRAVEQLPAGVYRRSDGQLELRREWEWVDPSTRRETRLKPGYEHSTTPGLLRPHNAWEWVKPGDKDNSEIRLKVGIRQSENDPRAYEPAAGWEWVQPKVPGNFEVRLKKGYKQGPARGEILPADGWEWVKPKDPKNYDVQPIVPTTTTPVAYHIPPMKANVAAIRLFEGPAESPPVGKRPYSNAFSRATARYIHVELEMKRAESGTEVSAEVPCTFIRPDKTVVGVFTVIVKLERPSIGSHSERGLGWAEPGRWTVGRHRVSCTFNGNEVARGEFDVK